MNGQLGCNARNGRRPTFGAGRVVPTPIIGASDVDESVVGIVGLILNPAGLKRIGLYRVTYIVTWGVRQRTLCKPTV
jgi:hypothetical protein